MDQIQAFNAVHVNPYCEGTGGRFLLHAQVGIAEDIDITPGTVSDRGGARGADRPVKGA